MGLEGKLGLQFVSLQSYSPYVEEEDLKIFLRKAGIKGLDVCSSTYYYWHLHEDYRYIIEKIVDLINVSDSVPEQVIELTLWLFKLYNHVRIYSDCLSDFLNLVKDLKLSDTNGKLHKASDLLLHDLYDPEEKWYKWYEKGFREVGPFVTPKYLLQISPSERDTLKEFFLSLGVKEKVGTEIVGKFAEWYVKSRLREKGFQITRGAGEGYDFIASKGGKNYYVEVKGMRRLGEVELKGAEYRKALELKNSYVLAVVTNIPNDPLEHYVINPLACINGVIISDEVIRGAPNSLDTE